MTAFKAYIVAKATKFDDFDILGTKLSALVYEKLSGVAEAADSIDGIAIGDGITAVIYPDTPLVDAPLLEKLAESVLRGEADGYKIGCGYIGKKGAELKEPPVKITAVNTLADVKEVLESEKYALIEKHTENGVVFVDAFSSVIERNVQIGRGTVIYPMNYLRGSTKIGAGATVFSYCDLTDTVVGDGTDIRSTFAVQAKIGASCTVGPFACLRKGAIIGNHCRVGDYVEIKNSTLEDNVKAAHLVYVGDSYVGDGTNIGCGVVFANYDGKVKRSVIVGKNVFIGCNTNLVAPLEVDEGAYIAAGSTVTQNVPGNSLCIARARQVVKNEWKPKN